MSKFRSSGQCRNLRFTIDPIHGYRLRNQLIRTINIIPNDNICQLQCFMEPNCVSYNFNKKEEANGPHKCDLNNATYEHDSEHSGDLEKNENYVYRGAEVNIQIPSTLGYARDLNIKTKLYFHGYAYRLL